MAYNNHLGYNDYPQQQSPGYGGYPSQGGGYSGQQHQDPFASHDSFGYPPQNTQRPYSGESHLGKSSSQWSLDEPTPLTSAAGGAGAGAAGGYSAVTRDKNNPYSKEYRDGNEAPKGNKVRKWAFIVTGVLIVIGVIVGIVAWRVTANKNDSSSSSSGSGKLQYIQGTSETVKSNPSDPSQFEQDSRLKKVFYGMAYTPFNALEPWCGATLANVTEDIQLLSQLTTRIRTYGSACNQSELVLQAIQDTKVNMTVWLGAYVGINETVNAQQQDWLIDALDKYGTDNVGGITIGNEYVLNADPLSSTDNAASRISYLTSQMSAFRTRLASKNYGKTLPVGTSDAGSEFTSTYVAGADYIMANVHPWFGGVNVDDAAGWTWEFFEENNVVLAEAAANKPTAYIAETGWPTESMTPENATLQGAVAGISELQTFLDTYPCQANQNGSYYFYFEPFDEPWKEQYGGVEPYWGLMDHNRKLKDITFPDCAVDSTTASG
ncbi:uncharacterized protein JCM6883_001524 [Sporobolomyces salmoneus]|uniref:uncharacterized protein n=1 Tax=Sporobolomyces salmoneus TaxID=183962 RepID=UPI0031738A1C